MINFFSGFWWLVKEVVLGKQFKRSEVEVVVLGYLKTHGEATTYALGQLFPRYCFDLDTFKRVNQKSLTIVLLYHYLEGMEKDGLIVTEEKDTAIVDGVVRQLDRKQFVRKLLVNKDIQNA